MTWPGLGLHIQPAAALQAARQGLKSALGAIPPPAKLSADPDPREQYWFSQQSTQSAKTRSASVLLRQGLQPP